jgi:hypothetical protein
MAREYWDDYKEGEVRALEPYEDPPTSSLVDAFRGKDVTAADSIVLRGYLGRSDILQRALAYLTRARQSAEAKLVDAILGVWATADPKSTPQGLMKEALAARTAALRPSADELAALATAAEAKAKAANVDETVCAHLATMIRAAQDAQALANCARYAKEEALKAGCSEDAANDVAGPIEDAVTRLDIARTTKYIEDLEGAETEALPLIPWRLYLTPRLDTYVDFHRSDLIAYRREPKAERQDACTIWLRIFQGGGRDPIPYRVVHETVLGPSFATWLGGDMVDDYFGSGSSGGAWGDQSAFGGGKPSTGIHCGSKNTGIRCLD